MREPDGAVAPVAAPGGWIGQSGTRPVVRRADDDVRACHEVTVSPTTQMSMAYPEQGSLVAWRWRTALRPVQGAINDFGILGIRRPGVGTHTWTAPYGAGLMALADPRRVAGRPRTRWPAGALRRVVSWLRPSMGQLSPAVHAAASRNARCGDHGPPPHRALAPFFGADVALWRPCCRCSSWLAEARFPFGRKNSENCTATGVMPAWRN
ncbi:hypothetical protein ZWY2020_047019 [Hordeum vulgare]|nr:hypothetical protein ZWY2020_047019 [Hordeum vulgare]